MKVAKFEFALRTRNRFRLPDFKGSVFRGKFGWVLKEAICTRPHGNCAGCDLAKGCPYTYLFETQRNGEEVPRPYILEPPLNRKRYFKEDEWLYLNLILVGKAIEFLPFFVYAFDKMGQEGIGEDPGFYSLEEVRALDHNRQKSVIYSKHNPTLERNFPRIELEDFRSRKESQVTLQFLTPAQIKIKGKIQHQPTFEQLIRGVLRRYQSLKHFHSDEPREFFEVDLQEAARVKVANDDVRSDGFVRYSNRQKRAIAMQGFTGSITYQGNLAPFLPWLQVGELIHVGKGAVFGMGWYRILTHAQ